MSLLFLAFAASQAAVQAAPPAAGDRFRACAAQAQAAPEQAIEAANAWRLQGGGIEARQCLGLAYVQLERWPSAATVYEQAARDAEAARDPRLPDFWVQAANAWLAAGESVKAVEAIDAALAAPALTDALRGEAHLDRARALVALGNPAGARQDLDRALALAAEDPFAWYLSAALARRQQDLVRARTDIDRALALAPANPEFLLLSGTIAGLAGDMEAAERLYRQVVAAAPASEAGRSAAAALATAREVEVPAPSAAAPAATAVTPPQSR